MMHPSRVRDVEVSVDDALKYHVSLGVVEPGCPPYTAGCADQCGAAGDVMWLCACR